MCHSRIHRSQFSVLYNLPSKDVYIVLYKGEVYYAYGQLISQDNIRYELDDLRGIGDNHRFIKIRDMIVSFRRDLKLNQILK